MTKEFEKARDEWINRYYIEKGCYPDLVECSKWSYSYLIGNCNTTHHFACECREAYFRDLEKRLNILRRYHGGDGTVTREIVMEALSEN